jgi:hypothetical protein
MKSNRLNESFGVWDKTDKENLAGVNTCNYERFAERYGYKLKDVIDFRKSGFYELEGESRSLKREERFSIVRGLLEMPVSVISKAYDREQGLKFTANMIAKYKRELEAWTFNTSVKPWQYVEAKIGAKKSNKKVVQFKATGIKAKLNNLWAKTN